MKHLKQYEQNNKLKINDLITFPYDVGDKSNPTTTAFKPYEIYAVNDSEYVIKDNSNRVFFIDKFDKDIIHFKNLEELELIKITHQYNL